MTLHRSPFREGTGRDLEDKALAAKAASGDKRALDQLIRRHQGWVYNLALRMMLNPDDAAELAQEALIKVITRIAQFDGRAAFRTWAWRIVVNQMLDAKRGMLEGMITDFDQYGQDLANSPSRDLVLSKEEEPERALIIKEAMHGCLLGMLLCLNREQRMIYILGDVFEAPSPVAAEILDISPESFRKKLSRSRNEIYAFMKGQCGLVNPEAPCRCAKKASAFMEQGWLEPGKYKFAGHLLDRMNEKAAEESEAFDRFVEDSFSKIFQAMPFYQMNQPDPEALAERLQDPELQRIFTMPEG